MPCAQVKVFEANCIYAGACAPQLFVYTPGMYSSSNNDFVRGTVTDFYEMFRQVSDAENDALLSAFAYDSAINITLESRVCPMDDMEAALKIRNEAMKQRCASVHIDHLKTVLMAIRVIADSVVYVLYVLFELVLGLLRLVSPGQDMQDIVAEVEFWFLQLVTTTVEAIKQFGEMIFRMIFNMGEFGKVMKKIVQACCLFIDFLVLIWNYTGCQVLKNVIAPLVKSLAHLISSVANFFNTGKDISRFLWTIHQSLQMLTCDYKPMDCNMDISVKQSVEFGALPVASRCWADFSPELDASDSFACTRSDTCRVSELSYGTTIDEYGFLKEDGNQIVCDACPLQPGGLVNSFGCDVYTKQCTCNRPKIQRTYCTSHQECQLQGEAAASCALVGDFQRPENTYGTMPCNSCPTSQPICLVGASAGSSRGVCSCLQSTPVFQSCTRADIGYRVIPSAAQLCAVALASRRTAAAPSSLTPSMDWNSLAAAACSTISMSNAYCYSVPGYGYLVVGLGVIDTSSSFRRRRRRLLGEDDDFFDNDEDDDDDEDATYSRLRYDVLSLPYWNSTLAKPCYSLAHAIAFEKNMSITDMDFLQRCVHWRRVGRDAMLHLNLTSLQQLEEERPWEAPDRLFMSLEDFASVLGKRKMLLLELASKMPQAAMFLLSRSSFLQPLKDIWETLRQNSIFHAWNALLLLGTGDDKNNSSNATTTLNFSSAKTRGRREEGKEEIMEVLDQFVLSRHKSMQMLYGGREGQAAVVSFLEGYVTRMNLASDDDLIGAAAAASADSAAKEEPTKRERLGKFRAKNLLFMQLIHQLHANNKSSHSHQGNGSSSSGSSGRSLLQMDDSIKTYSSIISATKEYSRIAVGKTTITDSWLQGPLQWPPR